MAKRDALRELQGRLATRLQAARTEGVAASWLAVEARGSGYLFPLSQSGEIFPWAAPQPVPYAQPWFIGVANLRGHLHGVVDLSHFLSTRPSGADGGAVARPQAAAVMTTGKPETRLIAFNTALEVNCALLVDRLAGLKHMADFVSSSEPVKGAPACLGHGYTDPKGVFWQEINLQTLSRQPDFLTISA